MKDARKSMEAPKQSGFRPQDLQLLESSCVRGILKKQKKILETFEQDRINSSRKRLSEGRIDDLREKLDMLGS